MYSHALIFKFDFLENEGRKEFYLHFRLIFAQGVIPCSVVLRFCPQSVYSKIEDQVLGINQRTLRNNHRTADKKRNRVHNREDEFLKAEFALTFHCD